MEIDVKHVDALLKAIGKKTGQTLDHYGFGVISEMTNGVISKKYFYETHRSVLKALKQKKRQVRLSRTKLNELAKLIGYDDFERFVKSTEEKTNDQLMKCIGSYYSYVRRNLEKGKLYKSPVQVIEVDGRIIMELQGGRLKYSGEIRLALGCLFIPLEAAGGKAFYHVYKIGDSQDPKVLQGTFSGVSNGSEPIAGRAVLVRTTESYKQMRNEELELSVLERSKAPRDKKLAKYFKYSSENNLSIKKTYSFDEEDL